MAKGRLSHMPRINIGKRSFQGALERYASRFDLLEVRPGASAKLRSVTLRKWRRSVPASFVFSTVLPATVAELRPGEEAEADLESALEVARELQSPVIVIQTPMSVTPTATNRKRLEALVAKLPHDVVRLAWEPSGLWEPEDTQAIAANLGLIVVRDAACETLGAGAVAYTRLRGLGEASRLGPSRMERVIKSLRSRREAYVVVETDQAQRVAKSIRDGVVNDGDGGKQRVAKARPVMQPLRADDEEQ